MAPRITIIGGGSNQWVPSLVTDVARTPALAETELVLEDLDGSRLPRMADYVRHVAGLAGIPLTVRTTTDQVEALEGADFVIVNISTGGFDSMAHDLAVPAGYGIVQSVGDSVGPGGISRALRNIPVFLGIARDMERCCPDAWLLNLTNPMTTLCRAVSRETSVKVMGLCHEVTMTQFTLSQLLGVPFPEIRLDMCGINHLPIVTAVDAGGHDGLEHLRRLADGDGVDEPVQMVMPEGLGHEPSSRAARPTRADILALNQVKVELFRRFGALPGAGDRHLVEFFPGFLTEASGHGKRWGVALTDIAGRRAWEQSYSDDLDRRLASDRLPTMPSGEIVHTVIRSILTGKPCRVPLNLPNAGQCPDLPPDVVVESMCVVDSGGPRGEPPVRAPAFLAEQLRRVSASQELTVEAAVSGRRDDVVAAMLADPLAGRIDFDQVGAMTGDLLKATAAWLPQFD